MKKKILVLGVLLLIITGCSSLVVEDPVFYVKADNITTKMENKDTFAFVIGDETCPACNAFMSGAQTQLKKEEGVALSYIDMDKLNDSEMSELATLVNGKLNGDFGATPTTYFVVEGKVEKVLVGAASYEELSEEYNKYIVE